MHVCMYACIYIYGWMATPSPNGSLEACLGKNPQFYSTFGKLKLNNVFVYFQFPRRLNVSSYPFFSLGFSLAFAVLSC